MQIKAWLVAACVCGVPAVAQAQGNCAYVVRQTYVNVRAPGGRETLDYRKSSVSCGAPRVSVNSPSIRIVGSRRGPNALEGSIEYEVEPNDTGGVRNITIQIASATVYVSQTPRNYPDSVEVRRKLLTQVEPPSGCGVPAAPGWRFYNDESHVWVWLEIAAGESRPANVSWRQPNYSAYRTERVTPTTDGGVTCLKAALPVKGLIFTGKWSVIVSWNNIQAVTVEFLLTGAERRITSNSTCTPGSVCSVTGAYLAFQRATASSVPLPTILGGMSVSVAGRPAPLLSVAPDRLDFQVPWDIPGDVTDMSIGPAGFPLNLAPVNPAIVAGIPVRRLNASGTDLGEVTLANRARAGDVLRITASGLGLVRHLPRDGALGFQDSVPLTSVYVSINGIMVAAEAVLPSTGTAQDVGRFRVTARVPDEVSPGDSVSVQLWSSGLPSNTVLIPVSGTPRPVAPLVLGAPFSLRAVPYSFLRLPVTGLRAGIPVGVRFSASGFDTVVPADPDGGAVIVSVPPFYDSRADRYGAGTVSVQVMQAVNGQLNASNTLVNFEISDLPSLNLPPGKLSVETLRAAERSSSDLRGLYAYIETSSGGKKSTARRREELSAFIDTTAALRKTIEDALAANASLRIGDVAGQPVFLDSEMLATIDRLIAAPLLAEAAEESVLISARVSARAAGAECENVDPPSFRTLRDLVTGKQPLESYSADFYRCFDAPKSIDELSAWLDRKMRRVDERWKRLALGFLPAEFALATRDRGPLAPKIVAARKLAALFSLPNWINLAGQTGLGALAVFTPSSSGVDERVLNRLAGAFGEVMKDRIYDGTGEKIGSLLKFDTAPVAGAYLGNVAQGVEDLLPSATDAIRELGRPYVEEDSNGNATLQNPVVVPSITVSGVARNAAGEPIQDGELELCPGLPGQAPGASGSTAGDGSYTLVMPVNFDDPSKLCRVILRSPPAPPQTAAVNVNAPKVINFPDTAAPVDVKLSGMQIVEGDLACGHARSDSPTTMTLPNTSLADLVAKGGRIRGRADSHNVEKGCVNNGTTAIYFGLVVDGFVAKGGKGLLTIGPDQNTWEIQIEGNAITGTNVQYCRVRTDLRNCTSSLTLDPVR